MPFSAHGNASKTRVATGTAAVEQFHWANLAGVNDFCLSMLEHFDRVEEEAGPFQEGSAEVQNELQRLLHNRCFSMLNFYSNPGFMKLYDDAIAALGNYDGRERPQSVQFLQQQLSQYGFVLTPRMWTRTDLLCIMILLLDPGLLYMNINQKKGEESDQSR
jgi:hypothetical protein